jgi:hypothetical protein
MNVMALPKLLIASSKNNMFELVECSQQNQAAISLALKEIKDANDKYFPRAATGKWWMP